MLRPEDLYRDPAAAARVERARAHKARLRNNTAAAPAEPFDDPRTRAPREERDVIVTDLGGGTTRYQFVDPPFKATAKPPSQADAPAPAPAPRPLKVARVDEDDPYYRDREGRLGRT